MSKVKAKKQIQIAQQQQRLAEQKAIKNMDPTALKQQFYSYRTRVNELIEQVNSLNVSIAYNNQKHLAETYEFQQNLKTEEEQRDRVKKKFEQIVFQTKQKWRNKKKSWELQKSNQEAKRASAIGQLNNRVSDFQNKLEKINLFKGLQQEYFNTITDLESKIERSGTIHKQEISRISDEYSNIRGQNSKIKDQKIQSIKQNEYSRARWMLDDRDKSIFVQNDILKNQRQLFKEEEAAIVVQKQKLKQEIKQQQKILKDLEKLNPSQQNYERSIKIVNLQDRISELKKQLQESKISNKSEKDNQRKKYDNIVKDLQKQIKASQNSTKHKEKQIKDLRMYSQMVLDQRKPLQWYILQVLSDNPKQQVDRMSNIDSILRQLFVKINSGVPPKNWRNSLKENLGLTSDLMSKNQNASCQQVSFNWPSQIKQQSESQLLKQ